MNPFRRLIWERPDLWSLALCFLAWAVMLGHALAPAHHHASFADDLAGWMWMVCAMMIPFILYQIRVTAARSLWRRRHRAIALFLIGYAAPWLLFGFAAAALQRASWSRSHAAPAVCFLAAALWQITPIYRREFSRRHRTFPLAPLGLRADRDCFRFGAFTGKSSLLTCWPIMLGCAFAGHNVLAMAAGMGAGALEHWSFRPRFRASFVVVSALSAAYLVLALNLPN